jgi:DNA-binding beta-propeller fold protein YncE
MLTTAAVALATVVNATAVPLPGGPPVVMDYLAWDAAHHRLWAPAGNTGNVDVVDVAGGGKVQAVGGQPTAPSSRPGRAHVGPSSATVGDARVFVGNRADHSVCAFDGATLQRGACVKLPSMPDGVAWVGATKEVWVTTPADQTLTVVDPATGKLGSVKLPGDPEGYAVDDARGRFYTNLEDKDQTVAVDVKTRKVAATWPSGCGADGPRGLALDAARQLLFVACGGGGAVVLDVAHGAKPVGRLQTGGGVDNIDYAPKQKLLYVASGKDGTLTIARVGDGGALTPVATAKTASGARVVVADDAGTAYVADSQGGRIFVVKPPL